MKTPKEIIEQKQKTVDELKNQIRDIDAQIAIACAGVEEILFKEMRAKGIDEVEFGDEPEIICEDPNGNITEMGVSSVKIEDNKLILMMHDYHDKWDSLDFRFFHLPEEDKLSIASDVLDELEEMK